MAMSMLRSSTASRAACAFKGVVPRQRVLKERYQRREHGDVTSVLEDRTAGVLERGQGLEQHGPAGGEGDEREEQQHQKVEHVAKQHAEEHQHVRSEKGRDEQHTDNTKAEQKDGRGAQRCRGWVLAVAGGH
eukprot:scaffold113672_cov68-Phaeocystis_antarctica.AAC.4